MIYNFNDYTFQQKLEKFILSIDESIDESFKDRILKFISNIKTKEQAKQFLLKTINNLKGNLKVKKYFSFFIIKAILTLGFISATEIVDLFKDNPNSIYVSFKNFLKPKEEFISKLFQRESSGRSHIVKGSYIGGFQFGKQALKDIGMGDITVKKFKQNPNIFPYHKQVEALDKLLKKNENYMKNYMNYIGKIINGIEITKSGILAAAHLVGQKKVKVFLSSNGKKDPKDGNGTKCSTYMREFSGYNLEN